MEQILKDDFGMFTTTINKLIDGCTTFLQSKKDVSQNSNEFKKKYFPAKFKTDTFFLLTINLIGCLIETIKKKEIIVLHHNFASL